MLNLLKPKKNVSVIIPTINDGNTIAAIIQFIKNSKLVKEIIVVDDNSVDNTVIEAKDSATLVYTSLKHGKGASMREGLNFATSENDICMFKKAGTGIAFCSESKILNTIADKIIDKKSFMKIIDFCI